MLTIVLLVTGIWIGLIGCCGHVMLAEHGHGLQQLDRAALVYLFAMHRILGVLAILWAVS